MSVPCKCSRQTNYNKWKKAFTLHESSSPHTPARCRDMDPARRRCPDPWELPHEMPTSDIQHLMAGSCPKHWRNESDWLTASHGARCQTPQLYFRTHCQDATHCPSSPGSTLSSRVVTRPTTRLVVEASSRSPQQAMAGPDSRQQQPSTRWRVERYCQTRSFWSDATVHADLATTTTTTTKVGCNRFTVQGRWPIVSAIT